MRFYFWMNDKCDQIRVVLKVSGEDFIVVKLFESEVNSVKVWHGDYKTVTSFWNMHTFKPEADFKTRLIKRFNEEVMKAMSVLWSLLRSK